MQTQWTDFRTGWVTLQHCARMLYKASLVQKAPVGYYLSLGEYSLDWYLVWLNHRSGAPPSIEELHALTDWWRNHSCMRFTGERDRWWVVRRRWKDNVHFFRSWNPGSKDEPLEKGLDLRLNRDLQSIQIYYYFPVYERPSCIRELSKENICRKVIKFLLLCIRDHYY